MESWKKPTPEQVDKALALLVHEEQYRYFFDRLENPEWIGPLEERGFFKKPPDAMHDEAESTVTYSVWPESRYLARIAKHTPDEVCRVILNMPETDNTRVHDDFLDAAVSMPPDVAARLVPQSVRWMELSTYHFLFPEKVGLLIDHLADGNQVEPSLTLARATLAVFPDPRSAQRKPEPSLLYGTPTPAARFPAWDYEQILDNHISALMRAAGAQGLDLLCNLLEQCLRIMLPDVEGRGEFHDYSYIWYPAIEDDGAIGYRSGPEESLVSAIRDAASQLVCDGTSTVEEVATNLEGKRWSVFRRIALHLVRTNPEAETEFVAEHLTSAEYFRDISIRPEYAMLLKERFGSLAAGDKAAILALVEAGPSYGNPDDDNYGVTVRAWQINWLALISPHLDVDWMRRYEALVGERDEASHPEFPVYSYRGWWGPTSPKASSELADMPVEDIVGFLESWQPDRDFRGPDPEGLGRELEAAVVASPLRFAAEATRFSTTDPTYVRSVLQGLRGAVEQETVLPWEPVLALCQRVVEQERDIPGRSVIGFDRDPDWGWTRKAIGGLLESGLGGENGVAIPHALGATVWSVLRLLTDDPDPTPEYETQYGGSNMGPATMSINTVRGEAMHAVLRYALWVRNWIAGQDDAKERLNRGFEEMPEVRDTLDVHLDIAREPSLTIRSVYGRWIPWLVLLDRGWVEGNIGVVFDATDGQERYFRAAWDAYVLFCTPSGDVFDMLRDQYRVAIDRIRETPDAEVGLGNPHERLAEHLVLLYGRGRLEFNEQDDLLSRFFSMSPPELRGHAIAFVGRALSNTQGAIDGDTVVRLQRLWEWRLRTAREVDSPDGSSDELNAFGWWFITDRFPHEWAVQQLRESIEITKWSKPDREVVGKLASLAESMPSIAAECLDGMVRGAWQRHGIDLWAEEARVILDTALRSTDEAARSQARATIDYLGRRGYLEFRDLVPN